MRTVVYTALFGGYDRLPEPVGDTACDFVCFTDDPGLTSKRWRIVRITATRAPAMMNRHVKLHPHLYVPEYDASVYIDANLQVRRDPGALADRYLAAAAFAAPRHPERDCVYEEIATCVAVGKADAAKASEQIARYRAEGYPAHHGLTENRLLLRRHHDPAVIALMEAWWRELMAGIPRDQASLQVVAWRSGTPIAVFDEDLVCGECFRYRPHAHAPLGLRLKIHLLVLLRSVMR